MRLLLIALFATLLLAAPASAARFQHNGPDIDFTTAASDTVRITATGHELGDPEQLTFTRGTGGTAFTIGAGCSIQIGIVRCGVSDETRLRFTTNERADLIDASRTETPFDASVPEIFDTKGGDDVLVAGPLADEVRAGAGRDSITGGPGADSLDGGPDDDVFVGLSEGDVVTGGDGADVLDLTGEVQGMTISLNNIGDDGPLGSSANVLGIETVMGTLSDDILSGGDGADTLDGRDGNDRIDARGGGADTVICGPGASRRRDRRRDRLGDRLRAGRAARRGRRARRPGRPRHAPGDRRGRLRPRRRRGGRRLRRHPRRDPPRRPRRAGQQDRRGLRRRRRPGVAGRRAAELRLHRVPQRHDARGPARRPRAPGRRARRAALLGPLRVPQEGRQGLAAARSTSAS